MAELATIARPYAQALFDTSRDKLGDTSSWLGHVAAIVGNDELQQLAANPKLGNDQLYQLIAEVMPTALPTEGSNFLRTVLQNGRLAALPEIARQFELLKNSVSGAADAVIYSAYPLEGSDLTDLVSRLEKRFNTRLNARVVTDASLIGGVRVVVGDEVLDTSVKARIEQMKQALTAA